MAEALAVRPDRKFVEEIIAAGGGDLKHCMQCANCAVVCGLAGPDHPFPRKEMVWAQWGLKDRLFADPDVWLCHQCNDCSAGCPRGARPGDMLAAVRRLAIRHYAMPRFFARMVNEVGLLPLSFLIPVALLTAALLVRGPVESALGIHGHPGFYADFFPHWLLIGFFSFFVGLALLAAAVGAVRFWKAMEAQDRAMGTGAHGTGAEGAEGTGSGASPNGIAAALVATLRSIFTHDRFAHCEAQKPRRTAHLTAFYGFLALFVVTVWAVIDLYVMPSLGVAARYPFGLLHPMKVLANVGAVLLLFGIVKAIADRRRGRASGDPGASGSTAFDGIFLWLLLGVGVTGLAAEVFRFTVEPAPTAALTTVARAVYFLHLVLVFQLLVYLPYSKFAHVLYRTVAMVYAEHTGRYRPVRRVLLTPRGEVRLAHEVPQP